MSFILYYVQYILVQRKYRHKNKFMAHFNAPQWNENETEQWTNKQTNKQPNERMIEYTKLNIVAMNTTLSPQWIINLTNLLYWHCHICNKWWYWIPWALFCCSNHLKRRIRHKHMYTHTKIRIKSKTSSIFNEMHLKVMQITNLLK